MLLFWLLLFDCFKTFWSLPNHRNINIYLFWILFLFISLYFFLWIVISSSLLKCVNLNFFCWIIYLWITNLSSRFCVLLFTFCLHSFKIIRILTNLLNLWRHLQLFSIIPIWRSWWFSHTIINISFQFIFIFEYAVT